MRFSWLIIFGVSFLVKILIEMMSVYIPLFFSENIYPDQIKRPLQNQLKIYHE